ncbi:MAG: hypothetical protein AAB428_00365 [Patescibacteria group bacterium]
MYVAIRHEGKGKKMPMFISGKSIAKIRKDLGLSQSEFSDRYKIALPALHAWEQKINRPSRYAIIYLKLIENNPELIANEVRKITVKR